MNESNGLTRPRILVRIVEWDYAVVRRLDRETRIDENAAEVEFPPPRPDVIHLEAVRRRQSHSREMAMLKAKNRASELLSNRVLTFIHLLRSLCNPIRRVGIVR